MNDVTRRAVVRGGVVVLGAAALGFDTVIGGSAATATPKRSDYASAIGTVFDVTGGGRTVQLRLTHADDIASGGSRTRGFILLFEPLAGARVPDGIYGVRSDGVPTHDLFMSGIGPDATVQAVINGMV